MDDGRTALRMDERLLSSGSLAPKKHGPVGPESNLFLITCNFSCFSFSFFPVFFPRMESDEEGGRRSEVIDDQDEDPNLRGKLKIRKECMMITSAST